MAKQIGLTRVEFIWERICEMDATEEERTQFAWQIWCLMDLEGENLRLLLTDKVASLG